MRVEVLSLEPLPAVPSLHVPHRDIVRARVAEDVAHRARFRDVATALADHDSQLGFPVQLLGMGRWEQHRRVVPDHRRRVLREERGEWRDLLRRELRTGWSARLPTFFEVLAVVPADAEHVARRTRDRGKELRVLEPNATTCGARRFAEGGPELLARKQQVEDIVLVTRSAHEVHGRDDRVVGRDHARRRTAAVLERADTHLASALHRRAPLFFSPRTTIPVFADSSTIAPPLP